MIFETRREAGFLEEVMLLFSYEVYYLAADDWMEMVLEKSLV
jgi:hypothetical protein